MEIRKDLATVRIGENCFGTQNKKKFLVIHQTGNQRKGADAQMHAKYQKGRIGEVSWHWQVDDKEAIQSFEHDVQCYHASDGLGDGNLNSIAIEGCINVDGNYKKSVDNMARLAAKILKDENISIMNMKQHYDFARDKKNCPQQIREGKEGINWSAFVSLVQGYINEPIVAGAKVEKPKTDKELADEVIKGIHGTGAERKAKLGSLYDAVQKLVDEMLNPKPVVKPKPVPKPVANKTVADTYKESGTFYPNDTIIVRNAPSTSATIVARYYKGEHVKYHTVHLKNGYVWLQYKRANGQQAYIPCRTYSNGKYGTLWGTIK